MKNTSVCSDFHTALGLERYTLAMKLIQTILVIALTGLSFSASAQWQWIDKEGHRVFSDRAPPADILDKNILKRPGNYKPPVAPAGDAAAGTDGAASAPQAAAPVMPASSAKTSGLDKELEARKKQAQEEEVAKKKAAEEQVTKAKIENCVRAKQAKTTFESGVRVSRTNAAGEREVMDDAARAEEIKRIQSIIVRDCK